jgi:hypothetical protein
MNSTRGQQPTATNNAQQSIDLEREKAVEAFDLRLQPSIDNIVKRHGLTRKLASPFEGLPIFDTVSRQVIKQSNRWQVARELSRLDAEFQEENEHYNLARVFKLKNKFDTQKNSLTAKIQKQQDMQENLKILLSPRSQKVTQ